MGDDYNFIARYYTHTTLQFVFFFKIHNILIYILDTIRSSEDS